MKDNQKNVPHTQYTHLVEPECYLNYTTLKLAESKLASFHYSMILSLYKQMEPLKKNNKFKNGAFKKTYVNCNELLQLKWQSISLFNV